MSRRSRLLFCIENELVTLSVNIGGSAVSLSALRFNPRETKTLAREISLRVRRMKSSTGRAGERYLTRLRTRTRS